MVFYPTTSQAPILNSDPVAVAVESAHASSASPKPSLATRTATLTQVAAGRWETIILLDNAGSQCPGAPTNYWLETTSPDLAISARTVTRITPGPCRVKATFDGLQQIPVSAVLVLDETGMLSSAQLSLSRNVGVYEYLLLPAILGLLMALLLLLFTLRWVKVYSDDGRRIRPYSHSFWRHPTYGSVSPKVSIVSVVSLLLAFLGTATFVNSLFPGISLNTFAILSAIAGIIAASGTTIYSILYARGKARNPLVADAFLIPPGPDTFIVAATGAVITVRAGADVGTPDSTRVIHVAAGRTIEIPAGSHIEFLTPAPMAFPDGPNVLVMGECSFKVTSTRESLTIAGSSLLADHQSPAAAVDSDISLRYPVIISALADVTISPSGFAALHIPTGTTVTAPMRRNSSLRRSIRIMLSQNGSNLPTATIGLVIVPVLFTMFGIGAELGLVGVLAVGLSDATLAARIVTTYVIAIVALFMLFYNLTAIQAITE